MFKAKVAGFKARHGSAAVAAVHRLLSTDDVRAIKLRTSIAGSLVSTPPRLSAHRREEDGYAER